MQNSILLRVILFLSVFYNHTTAQNLAYENISIGNINARINANGMVFLKKYNDPGDTMTSIQYNAFEWPKGSNKHTNFAGAIWMGAYETNGTLRLSQQTYNQGIEDFNFGPIRDTTITTYNTTYDQKYNKVWKITQTEINYHKSHVGQLLYVPSPNILNWPGNGNVTKGESGQLAPYFDVNNDQIYNAFDGDYPLIKGDEALFLIYNDQKSENPLNVEVKAMFYAYNSPTDTALYNTIFSSYSVTNTNNFALNDFKFGVWEDFELGYSFDDYIACSSLNNYFYAYNGDADDEGASGYGSNAPLSSIVFLNQNMTHFTTYKNDFTNYGNPLTPIHFYNYMNGKWKNGDNITYGENGNNSANLPTNYMFNGEPEDTLGWHTGWNYTDARGVGSTTIQTILPNETICIDLAYVVSRDLFSEIGKFKLRDDITHVKDFYNMNLLNCAAKTNVSIQKYTQDLSISIFPNPTSGLIRIESDHKLGEIQLLNLTGQILKTLQVIENQADLDLSEFPKGMYFLKGNGWNGKIIRN